MPEAIGQKLTSKRTVYIGGLSEDCHEALVRAAAVPFGPVKSVEIPRDFKSGTHRGFAFVEFEDPDDAVECIYNMNGSELLGRTLNVSLAQPHQHKLGSEKAIWTTDEWFKEQTKREDREAENASNAAAEAVALKENAPVPL